MLDKRLGRIMSDGTVQDTKVCASSGREVGSGMIRYSLGKGKDGHSYFFRVYGGRQRDVDDAFIAEMKTLIPTATTTKKASKEGVTNGD